ncbi:hypothetical protein AcV7_009730 [Taiwanofungus camphoratus]|nr:hypothetical protein AcV7_009730 [Antrodia cinnamomea]
MLVMIIPCLTYLASTVLSVLSVVELAKPEASLWARSALNFNVPYWSISMALSILLTLLLVSRLLWMRRQITSTMGIEPGKMYTNVAAMMVEPALPYSLVSLIYIILYGMRNTAQSLFLALLVQAECTAPELIVLRVVSGRAWSTSTRSQEPMSEIQFNSEAQTESISNMAHRTNDIPTITFCHATNAESKFNSSPASIV